MIIKKIKSIKLPILLLIICSILIISGMFLINKYNSQKFLYDITIPKTYNEMLKLNAFGNVLNITPINAQVVKVTKPESNIFKYIDAYQNTDIVQTLSKTKLKEDIVLKKPGHPMVFKYRINTDEYDFKKDSQGNINFYLKGHKGEELYRIFTIPAPYMIDVNNKKSSTADVETSLSEDGILTLKINTNWLKQAAYPIILDPTIEINILNVHSSPVKGEDWEVRFTTKGRADLRIIPNNEDTVRDDEFTGLYCGNQKTEPRILQGDVIYYPDWQCNEIAKVIHYTLKTGHHTLRFEFGEETAYAHNTTITTVVYVALQTTDGSIGVGGRTGIDGFCQNNQPGPVPCKSNIRALMSVNEGDGVADMPANYGYPSDRPLKWADSITGGLTQFASNWADALDVSITVNRQDGTGDGTMRAWTGSNRYGAAVYYRDCLDWTYDGDLQGGSGFGGVGYGDYGLSLWIGTDDQYDCRSVYSVMCACEVECEDDYDCGLCEECTGGSCVSQPSTADDKDECGTTTCYTGNCDGAGACGIYSGGEEGACATCYECNDGDSDCDLIADHTQDTTGSNTCIATCKECDGAGSCANQDVNQDYFTQCGIIQCDGGAVTPYYHGWDSLTCYYRLDVTAADAKCDGATACKIAADYCPTQGQDGSTGAICECVAAQENCSSTTAGTCDNPQCVPDIPTINYPSDGATGIVVGTNLAFNYSDPGSNNCIKYDLKVDDNADFSSLVINETNYSTEGPWSSGTVIHYPDASGLSYNTKYYWKARVYSINWSEWSDGTWDFTTTSEPSPAEVWLKGGIRLKGGTILRTIIKDFLTPF